MENPTIITCTTYYKPHTGGVEKYIESYAKEGCHKVITLNYNGELKMKERNIFRLPCLEVANGFATPTSLKKTKLLIQKTIDESVNPIIVTHTRFYPLTWIAGFVAKKNNVGWVHFEHGNCTPKYKNWAYRFGVWLIDKTMGQWVFKNATKIIAISHTGARWIKNIQEGKI